MAQIQPDRAVVGQRPLPAATGSRRSAFPGRAAETGGDQEPRRGPARPAPAVAAVRGLAGTVLPRPSESRTRAAPRDAGAIWTSRRDGTKGRVARRGEAQGGPSSGPG